MAKPICIVYFNPETFGAKRMTAYELTDAMQSRMEDYHVLAIPSNDREREDLYLQVFHEKDFTEIQYQELKALIENHLQHQSQAT